MTPRPHDATAVWHGRIAGLRLVASIALLTAAVPLSAVGQSSNPTTRTTLPVPVSPSNGKDSATGDRPAGEVASRPTFGLLRPEDGTVVPLPAGTKYEDFLAWISARRGPGFGINAVTLTGQPDGGGRAEFDAEIIVVVHRDDEWVRVPLGFTEATLIGVEHSGTGLASYESFAKDVGYTWSLQGRGEHRLQLKLLVPLSERSGETRLALTTPSNAATTHLSLKLPSDPSVVANGGVVRSTFSAEQQTTVEWVGPGGRVDLGWRPQIAAAQPADLAASTVIVPSVTGKNVQLRAVQKITPSRGQVSSIRTLLPAGFSLEGVTGALYRTYSEDLSENGRIVTVQLSEATGSTFELTYRVNTSLPSGGTFIIEGFSLPDVPPESQSGRVQFERSTGYSITPIDGAEGVQRIEMLEPMPAAVSSAFAFSAQPFRLTVKAEPIPPSFAVTPTLEFHVLPDRLDLDGEFAVEVRKGELREVRLNWPASEWSVSPIRAGPVQEFPRTMDAAAAIEIGVPTTVSSFTVPIRASRPRDDVSDQTTVPIPKLEGTNRQKAEVVSNDAIIDLRFPTNLVVNVTASGEALKPLEDLSKVPSIAEPTDERRMLLIAPANATELVFGVKRLDRQVSASTSVSIQPRGENLHVEERIDYEILYEPSSSLQLMVPESLLTQGLVFFDGAHQPLKATIGERSDGLARVLVDLGAAVLGSFSVTTRFDLTRSVPIGESGQMNLPIVLPVETQSGASLRIAPLRKHVVRVVDPDWILLQSTDQDVQELWVASTPSHSIGIQLEPKSQDDTSSPVVSKMLQRSLVRRDGSVVTYADFRFDRVPRSVAVRFPQGLKPDSISWRGKSLSPTLFADEGDALAELDLEGGSGPPVLAVAYRQTGEPTGLADARSLQTVRLDDGIVRETLWQLALPESQHLFVEPADYEPRFRWGLGGNLLSTRRPAEKIGAWFGSDVPSPSPEFDIGRHYEFMRAGGPKPFTFSSISRSLVVLIGAGTAILVGYAFANGLIVHRRRALVAVGLAILLTWAFFPNQVQIFLPPAAFGLSLVTVAAVVEWLLQRRQDRLSASVPSAVDFVTILPGDGSHSNAPSAIGSEEPTVVRTTRPAEPVGSNHGQ